MMPPILGNVDVVSLSTATGLRALTARILQSCRSMPEVPNPAHSEQGRRPGPATALLYPRHITAHPSAGLRARREEGLDATQKDRVGIWTVSSTERSFLSWPVELLFFFFPCYRASRDASTFRVTRHGTHGS